MSHTRPLPFVSRLGAACQAFGRLLAAAFALPVRGRRSHVMNAGRNEGPPDLDELWRDFNRKLTGLFGGKGRACSRRT
jgi:modulator of FtsH protease HflK